MAQIANDNSDGQLVLSGKTRDLEDLITLLKESSIKNIKLPVSAPFHCSLMSKATSIMSITSIKEKLIKSVIFK